jgi:hypothetical protein
MLYRRCNILAFIVTYDLLRHGKPLQINMLLNYTAARPGTKRSRFIMADADF